MSRRKARYRKRLEWKRNNHTVFLVRCPTCGKMAAWDTRFVRVCTHYHYCYRQDSRMRIVKHPEVNAAFRLGGVEAAQEFVEHRNQEAADAGG